ncbi:unnamed protein product, partial [Enterobius vermicularis]|uniref:BTB domain-containing protein n=1 Tax=Enterobius vermicularis TaxID=51028 RepID=A0A0N4VIY6_ENTVE
CCIKLITINYIKKVPEGHHINEIVSLNVGGTYYQTFYGTLATRNCSFFSHIFQIDRTGRVTTLKQQVIEDEQGRVFVNRDGKLFAYILQYLRDCSRMELPDDTDLLRQIGREAEFFGIDRLLTMVNEKITDLEQRRNMREERLDALNSMVRHISQQLYVTSFKK